MIGLSQIIDVKAFCFYVFIHVHVLRFNVFLFCQRFLRLKRRCQNSVQILKIPTRGTLLLIIFIHHYQREPAAMKKYYYYFSFVSRLT